MKKIISLIVSFFLTISVWGAVVAFGTCGDAATWSLDDAGTLTISGTGAMANYGNSNQPWYSKTSAIRSVVIETGITSIGNYAFYYSRNLTSVSIPNSVTSIGRYAFQYCSGLTSITIPNSVNTIGSRAFRDCSGLTSVAIPNSVGAIYEGTFSGCTNLASVSIPNSVTTIMGESFSYCYSLASFTLSKFVTKIYATAFKQCESLTSIVVEEGNATYDSRNNCNAIIETATNKMILGCKNTTFPEDVTTIGGSAFATAKYVTSIVVPNSVSTIESNAFSTVNNLIYSGDATGSPWGALCRNGYVDGFLVYADAAKTTLVGCSSYDAVGSITIPEAVTTIGTYAFNLCSHITSAIVPASVTSLGQHAFSDCTNLTSCVFESTIPPTFPSATFQSSDKAKIFVPKSSVDAYKNAANFATYKSRIYPFYDDQTDPSITEADKQTLMLRRTLWHDGYYNTLCLPFSLTAEQIAASPLAGYTELKTFQSAVVNDGNLDIVLEDATSIQAGKPYFISWPVGENVVDPVFTAVNVTATSGSTISGATVSCVGSLAPTAFTADDKTKIFLGANNQLFWSGYDENLPGFRAYFSIPAGLSASAPVRHGMPARRSARQPWLPMWQTPRSLRRLAPSVL